ncbi:isoleucine--tRNA ligase [Candidatus Methanocrinis natronophilus]|uniref:Isoleucine--tRNA ligase n=1 Tax=Candidatus Methanocrinis natronophilus TaxID=3033396 RepID=A0ABT5X626_9EURY|nr:isoleucine--tRNA ligase [Candidatus Methanocrinis natronophilus]MDF0590037.1 isoleucine--tRNA ligase [Candidatus Methanocrinis natronophilus]
MISEVAGQYDAKEVEGRVRKFWEDRGIYALARTMRTGGRKFFFVDGPPYTTGRIHLGTAWNKIIKDSILRYRSMNGFEIKDRAGWDMHGLPIEVKVEEHLGFESKKDIETYGVDRFIDKCKEFALSQKDQMTEQFRTLGAWLNWEDPYMTLKDEYLEAAWWTLKRSDERGLLERGFRVVNWCPRCETAIADAEVEYWEETDPSVYVKFPIVGEEKTFMMIWTTTPWTIPANVGVAVHPDFEYSKVRAWKDDLDEAEILIIASPLVESVLREGRYKDYEVLDRFRGTELAGLEYEHPLADLIPAQREIVHKIHLADFVTAENTGSVHIAPGHGLEDFELGVAEGMEIFCPVGEDGRYTKEAGEKYAGKYVRAANGEVDEDLADRGLLLAEGEIVHRYGHCWRCKTPIIYIATPQWFLKISEIRDDMLDEIAKVKWYPDWAGSARFRDWISGARDWCISRQRYWGIPLPIWICRDCGKKEVIGSMEELRLRSGAVVEDLHRPAVDLVTIRCSCGGEMRRVPDVFDVWFDSAVASWATLNYPGDQEEIKEWWPADFITEGHDQTRGWFYSQLGASMVSFGVAPYRSVLMHGFTLDDKGKKMSKSIGNVVSPEEVVGKFGADTLRLYVLSSNAPWEDIHFSWDEVGNTNRMLNILWNAYRFPLPYMILDGFDPKRTTLDMVQESLRPEDRWILSRTNTLAAEVETSMGSYQLQRATRAIADFVLEDLSRWYIQLVRPRTWIETDDPDKLAAYATILEVMTTLAKILAPFAPFTAETIYQNLVRGTDPQALESVHLCNWQRPREELIDSTLEEEMALVREVVEAVSNARQKGGRKLRWPVAEVTISPKREIPELGGLLSVLKSQTNSKRVTVAAVGEMPEMEIALNPVPKKIGPAFKGEAQKVIEALKGADPLEARDRLIAGEFMLGPYAIAPDMVEFIEKIPENLVAADFSSGTVYVDVTLTEDLRAEGYAREIIRRIQDMRKEMDLRVEEKIEATIRLDDEVVRGLLERMRDHIAAEVRAARLEMGSDLQVRGFLVKEWSIEDLETTIAISRG